MTPPGQPGCSRSPDGHIELNDGNVYTLRHTFATNALAAGLSLYEVSRYMGTSVVQISKTYGHLAQGAEDATIAKLDAAAGGSGV
jgi:site-specific recombinase XerD